jgi:hypothetical protein
MDEGPSTPYCSQLSAMHRERFGLSGRAMAMLLSDSDQIPAGCDGSKIQTNFKCCCIGRVFYRGQGRETPESYHSGRLRLALRQSSVIRPIFGPMVPAGVGLFQIPTSFAPGLPRPPAFFSGDGPTGAAGSAHSAFFGACQPGDEQGWGQNRRLPQLTCKK